MKKITIFIPSMYLSGGAERVAHQLANDLSDTYSVTVLTLAENIFEDAQYTKISLGFSHSKLSKLWSMVWGPRVLANYCKKERIELVISHMERANFISLLSKIPTIAVVHNYKYLHKPLNALFISWLYPRAESIVCVSKGIEGKLQELFSLENTKTIYNYFDFKKINDQIDDNLLEKDNGLFTNGKYTFINIGRLTEQKGQDILLNAFLNAQIPNSQLIIVGDGPHKNMLESVAHNSLGGENVHILGARKNVFPLLKHSDIFVLSSRWEGFGLVLVEALSVGLPIISTNCMSGPKEILMVGNESFGTLVPTEDKEQLIKAMRNSVGMLVDSEKQKNRALAFSKEHTVSQWLKLIS